MPSIADVKLVDALYAKSKQWQKRFSAFADGAGAQMTKFFATLPQERRFLLLSYMNTLNTDPAGYLVSGGDNILGLNKVIEDYMHAGMAMFQPGSEFSRYMDKQYKLAANLGVEQAGQTFKLATGTRLPPGYQPPTLALAQEAYSSLASKLVAAHELDVGQVATVVRDHLFDPTGTPEGLRTALLATGQLDDGLLDTLGRRISSSERADRIAKYELMDVAGRAQERTVADIYHGGKPKPHEDFYQWRMVGDSRTEQDSRIRDKVVLTRKEWGVWNFGDGRYGVRPLRPRDRCVMVFMRPEWFDEDTRKKYFSQDGRHAVAQQATDKAAQDKQDKLGGAKMKEEAKAESDKAKAAKEKAQKADKAKIEAADAAGAAAAAELKEIAAKKKAEAAAAKAKAKGKTEAEKNVEAMKEKTEAYYARGMTAKEAQDKLGKMGPGLDKYQKLAKEGKLDTDQLAKLKAKQLEAGALEAHLEYHMEKDMSVRGAVEFHKEQKWSTKQAKAMLGDAEDQLEATKKAHAAGKTALEDVYQAEAEVDGLQLYISSKQPKAKAGTAYTKSKTGTAEVEKLVAKHEVFGVTPSSAAKQLSSAESRLYFFTEESKKDPNNPTLARQKKDAEVEVESWRQYQLRLDQKAGYTDNPEGKKAKPWPRAKAPAASQAAWERGLTHHEREAVDLWKGSNWREVRGYQKARAVGSAVAGKEDGRHWAGVLEQALARGKPYKGNVYRGARFLPKEKFELWTKAKTITFPSLDSWSTEESVARSFVTKHDPGQYFAILFKVRGGNKRGVNITEVGGFTAEKEVLMPSLSKFKIVEVQQKTANLAHVILEAL